jgi:hypothetical protein
MRISFFLAAVSTIFVFINCEEFIQTHFKDVVLIKETINKNDKNTIDKNIVKFLII